jgi:hypothetical protein
MVMIKLTNTWSLPEELVIQLQMLGHIYVVRVLSLQHKIVLVFVHNQWLKSSCVQFQAGLQSGCNLLTSDYPPARASLVMIYNSPNCTNALLVKTYNQ